MKKVLFAAEACVYLAFARLAFYLPPGFLLARLIDRALVGEEAVLPRVVDVARLQNRLQRVFLRWPLRTYCLERSLVLLWAMRRRSLPGVLRIGVRHNEGGLQAHAWVEAAGQPLNDAASHCRQFEVLIQPGMAPRVSTFLRFAS